MLRPEILNANSNEPPSYPYSIYVNKSSGSCNNINDPYAKLRVSDVVKNMNVKVLEQDIQTGKKLVNVNVNPDASVCKNKCRCECEKLIEKGICVKGFISNPSSCECECDKSWDVAKYLDYGNCKCRKIVVDKLVEECSGNFDRNEMIYDGTVNDHCRIYIELLVIIGISRAYFPFYWC